jgi:hypothetical protein
VEGLGSSFGLAEVFTFFVTFLLSSGEGEAIGLFLGGAGSSSSEESFFDFTLAFVRPLGIFKI